MREKHSLHWVKEPQKSDHACRPSWKRMPSWLPILKNSTNRKQRPRPNSRRCPDSQRSGCRSRKRQRDLTENRLRLADIRSSYERLHQEDSNRNLRIDAIRSEQSSWQHQITNATRQLDTLHERKRTASVELDKLASRPGRNRARAIRIDGADGSRRDPAKGRRGPCRTGRNAAQGTRRHTS